MKRPTRPGEASALSPSASLRHFTNRVDERACFAGLLAREAGAHLPVLSFYGVGGTGKTWLLQKLREEVQSAGKLPLSYLDFSVRRGGEIYQRDHPTALAEIQRQLGIPCPRFEVAYNVMLLKQGVRTELDSPVGEAANFGWQVGVALVQDAKALLPVATAGVLLENVTAKVLEKIGDAAGHRLSSTKLGKWLENRATDDFLRQLLRMTAQDIIAELVGFLAIDLHENLPVQQGKQCRAVFLFDTSEDLIRGAGRTNPKERSVRESWIQELYRALLDDDATEPHGTVLFVLGGRDRLDWGEAFEDCRYLDQHRIAGLSRADACQFLENCGITDAALQEAILRVSPDERHPDEPSGEQGYHAFSLGLCADTVTVERAAGREPDPKSFALSPGDEEALVKRFLESFDGSQEAFTPWMYTLALPPRWDEVAARNAYSSVAGAQQDAAWDGLVSYSFVQPPLPGESWWTLHVQMREALRARYAKWPDRVQRDHEFWRKHWAKRSTQSADVFAALEWYHSYQLDPEDALQQWTDLADSAFDAMHSATHDALLGWWAPTGITTRPLRSVHEADVLFALGSNFLRAKLGSHSQNVWVSTRLLDAASLFYGESGHMEQFAKTLNLLGHGYSALVGLGHSNLALFAIHAHETALQVYSEVEHPEERAETMMCLGNAYCALKMGDREENLLTAIDFYTAPFFVYTKAHHPLKWAAAMMNLGCAHTHLAVQYSQSSEEDCERYILQAIKLLTSVLSVYTEADHPQEWAATLVNIGNSWMIRPGGSRVENAGRAIDCFAGSLRVYTEADQPRDWAIAMSATANACYLISRIAHHQLTQRADDSDENLLAGFTEEMIEWATRASDYFLAASRGFARAGSASDAEEAAEKSRLLMEFLARWQND